MPGPTKRSRQNRARRDQKIFDNSPFKGLTVGEMEDMPQSKSGKTKWKQKQNESKECMNKV